jgi:exosome complex RNA-binding protein Rrp42 (RNase PH superfamily)
MIADPTKKEEQLSTGVVTIVTLDSDELCMVQKSGQCQKFLLFALVGFNKFSS